MGGSFGKFAEGIAKAGAKAATTGVLTYAIPIFGPLIAGAINSLYAEGGDVQALNDKIKAIAPDDAKFKTVNSPEGIKALITQFPKEAKKAGFTADKVDAAVAKIEEQKAMAKGGMVSKSKSVAPAKVKKERSPAQKAATAKMLAALKASKAKK